MMDRNVTINIDGRVYQLVAKGEEEEEILRKAAKAVDERERRLRMSHSSKELVDLVTFIAINESRRALKLERSLNALQGEAAALTEELQSYLK